MTKQAPVLKRHFQNSDEICRYVAAMCDPVILSFSCGKDSVAAWLQMRRYFKRIVPYFFYLVPGLKFVEDGLRYYEDYFKTEIYRIPHPSAYRLLNNLIFQAPENCHIVEESNIYEMDYDESSELIAAEAKIPLDTFTAHGTRASDSIMRRSSVKKWGSLNPKRHTFMPIFDWKKADVIECFVKARIKLPADYTMFGRSFDGIDYRFIEPIKNHFPQDFERILEMFPLADLEIKRREWRERYYGKEAGGGGSQRSTVRFFKFRRGERR